MRHSQHLTTIALVTAIIGLAGCNFQTPWSTEYHLRQYEEWRTLGDRARVNSTYDLAESYYKNSLDELRQAGAKPAQLAQAIQDIAETNLLQKNYANATSNFQKALAIYDSLSKNKSEKFALSRCLVGLGLAQSKTNEMTNAKKQLELSVQIVKQLQSSLDSNKPLSLAPSLACGWIPQLCEHSGAYWLAALHSPADENTKNEFQKLMNDKTCCPEIRLLAADSYSQILRGEHNESAAQKVEESFDILRDVDSATAANVQRNYELATMQAKNFEKKGDIENAAKAYKDALRICREAKLDSPTRLVTSICNLAFFYLNNGIWAEAVPLLEECVAIQEKRFGPEDRALAMPLSRLARALINTGDFKRANSEANRGYLLSLKSYGIDNQFTARAEAILAAAEIAQSNYSDAEEHSKHALSVLIKDPDRNARTIVETKLNLITVLENDNDRERCLVAAKDAADFALEHGSYLDQVRTLKKLCQSYTAAKQVQDAKSTLKQALEILDDAALSPSWHKWAINTKNRFKMEFSELGLESAKVSAK